MENIVLTKKKGVTLLQLLFNTRNGYYSFTTGI